MEVVGKETVPLPAEKKIDALAGDVKKGPPLWKRPKDEPVVEKENLLVGHACRAGSEEVRNVPEPPSVHAH